MSKLLLDECIPRRFKSYLPGHESLTVPEAGLAGKKNGELLSFAESAGFEVFLTISREQNLARRNLAVLIIRTKSSRLVDLLPHVPKILSTLGSIEAGQLVHVP